MRYRRRLHKWLWRWRLTIVLSLAMVLNGPLAGAASSGSSSLQPDPTGLIGLVSSSAPCLAANSGALTNLVGSVQLNWSGQAKAARLVLDAAGTHAAQPVRVNGQVVGSVPAGTQGQACGLGQAVYLDFAASMLRSGQNQIEISDAGLPGDAWTAANARLEVFGAVPPPQVPGQAPGNGQAPAASQIISFVSHYDGSTQQAAVQVPSGSAPVPLVIYAHGRYGMMEDGISVLGVAANAKGWLLASPQLHGHWPTPPSPPGAFAYASLESQYDILGTLQYLLSHSGTYNVDPSRIYLMGDSMGAQVATVTGAKYPDVFAALFDNKGPTDFQEWYSEQSALLGPNSDQVIAMRQECYTGSRSSPIPRDPSGNPHCYNRRSGMNLARNLIHVPISMTHSYSDLTVPITHAINLRDAINSFGPDRTATLYANTDGSCGIIPDYYHCYVPVANDVLNFFQPFTLQGNQAHLNLISDESKSYYWLNIVQSANDDWTFVEATASPVLHTVSLKVTDQNKNNVTLGLNLGSTPIKDWAGLSHPGLGLPPGSYHIQGGGLNTTVLYNSGYLTINLPLTNQTFITLSPTSWQVFQVFIPAVAR